MPIRSVTVCLCTALSLFVTTGASRALARTPVNVTAEMVTGYTDNLFRSYGKRADWIQQVYVGLDYGGPGLAAYYTAEASFFAQYDDLFTQTHVLGVSAAWSGSRRRRVSGDLSLALRAGQPGYEYKDYAEVDGYLAGKFYLRPALMLRTGGGLRLRQYRHARDFDYVEPTIYGQLSRFLPTRTTLVAGVDLGVKAYLRTGDRATDGGAPTYVRTSDDNTQTQATTWVKVAQSITPNTGLQL